MRVLVTGAASGLGFEISDAISSSFNTVYRFDLQNDKRMNTSTVTTDDLKYFFGKYFDCDVLINCAGVNQNEWFEDVTYESFQRVMDVNAWGYINMTKAVLPYLKESPVGCVINIVSNAAHMPMTSSLAYNTSKAAALMITKQMAHELTPKHGLTIFSISPNKLAGTGMSNKIDSEVQRVRGWSAEYATEYQKKGLMHGLETDPSAIADFIAGLLTSGQYKFMSGTDIPFGK